MIFVKKKTCLRKMNKNAFPNGFIFITTINKLIEYIF